MAEEVKHYQVNGKYRIQLERSAAEGFDGFQVEVNGDDMEQVKKEANELYCWASKGLNFNIENPLG